MDLGSIALSVVLTIVSVAVGGLITWWVSRWYYQRAGAELSEEAAALRAETVNIRTMINTISRVIEDPGSGFVRDADQMMTGGKANYRTLGGNLPAQTATLGARKLPPENAPAQAPEQIDEG